MREWDARTKMCVCVIVETVDKLKFGDRERNTKENWPGVTPEFELDWPVW